MSMTLNDYVERNLNALRENGDRNHVFGASYVQRICKIGYNQAQHTIEAGLERGILLRDPTCEWKYLFNQQSSYAVVVVTQRQQRGETMQTTEQQAHSVLAKLGNVEYINVFGHALVAQGVVQSHKAEFGMSNQGAALLAGKWLRRLEAAGLARKCPVRGWIAVTPATVTSEVSNDPMHT